MNTDWMRERLESFDETCIELQAALGPAPGGWGAEAYLVADKLPTSLPTAREIVKRLDPALVDKITQPRNLSDVTAMHRAIQQSLGILRDQDEWQVNLAPDAPSLIADQFHHRIWAAASALWDTGKYRVAVGQAAVALSAHIASKAHSSLTGRELVNEVFAPGDPPQGRTRLHMPGDKASRSWRSRQDGLHHLAQGAFAGIRNIATHDEDEWPEQVALEHLAVLSVVARWTDETELVTAAAT
jgi:hypothetical protein